MAPDSAGRATGLHRRTLLTALAGLPASALAGRAAASSARAGTGSDVGPMVPPALEPTATLDVKGLSEAVVDDAGETVYCAVRDGFAVVDVSDPANPTLLAEERELSHSGNGPMQRIYDVKYADDRLIVAGPNAGSNDDLVGFFVYDVSDPASPERVAFQGTRHGIHNCFVDGNMVYLTGGNLPGSPTMIYDISNDEPEKVGDWSATQEDKVWDGVYTNYLSCHDVYVQDDILYVSYWDAGTWLVDVSDPANPTAVARLGGRDPEYLADLDRGFTSELVELPGNSHYSQPNDDGSAVFVGKEAWDREDTGDHDGGPGGIELWSMGEEPTRESIIQSPAGPDSGATSHNFGVRDGRLYASWYAGGVAVYDVTDRAAPQVLGAWSDPETTSFWTAKPIHEGFVGAVHMDPSNDREEKRVGEGGALYVFPEPESGSDPAPLMEPLLEPATAWTQPPDSGGSGGGDGDGGSDSDGGGSDGGGGDGGGSDGGGTTAATGGDETTTTTASSADSQSDGNDESAIPGFGVGAAVTAVGATLGLARLLGEEEN
ncbi:LVIVD repeat-containing protein [Haloarchaeobius sp. DT45]|uniref:LVIVD repeat-containing protein n=1 Tax=Haloarchaeobius sp. DT45 TaxID=3446116 RepID=UPI003F6C72B6